MNFNVQSENLRRYDIDLTKKTETIKDDITKMGLKVVEQICLLQGRDQWHACVNVVMNLHNPYVMENIMVNCAVTVV